MKKMMNKKEIILNSISKAIENIIDTANICEEININIKIIPQQMPPMITYEVKNKFIIEE